MRITRAGRASSTRSKRSKLIAVACFEYALKFTPSGERVAPRGELRPSVVSCVTIVETSRGLQNKIRNSNFEIRNKPQRQYQLRKSKWVCLKFSDFCPFGFVSNFGFRASRLGSVDTYSERRPESLTRGNEPQPAAAGEGARRRSHRLERDIVLALWREDLRVAVALE